MSGSYGWIMVLSAILGMSGTQAWARSPRDIVTDAIMRAGYKEIGNYDEEARGLGAADPASPYAAVTQSLNQLRLQARDVALTLDEMYWHRMSTDDLRQWLCNEGGAHDLYTRASAVNRALESSALREDRWLSSLGRRFVDDAMVVTYYCDGLEDPRTSEVPELPRAFVSALDALGKSLDALSYVKSLAHPENSISDLFDIKYIGPVHRDPQAGQPQGRPMMRLAR